MSVERFDTACRPFSKGMIKDTLGSYIKYSDYEKLESQLKEVKKGSPENPYIVCGTCEKPMKLFNVEFKKWYCFTCRKYANN